MTSGKHRGNEFPGEVLWLCLGAETNTKDPLICEPFLWSRCDRAIAEGEREHHEQ